MRIGFTIALLFIFCFAQGQDIEVVNSSSRTHYGKIGGQVLAPIKIKNISNQPVYVFVKRTVNKIGSTQTTNFCWGKECFDKAVDKLPISKRIEPGETSENLISVLETGLVSVFSTVKYEIYTRNNPHQIVEHEITYVIEDKIKASTLFSSEDLFLNEIYPNPVKEYAFIDYQIINKEVEVKILIHNVLGSVVGDFILNPLEKELKIPAVEYNAGVYFYTLYIDGDGVITKKLVIRR